MPIDNQIILLTTPWMNDLFFNCNSEYTPFTRLCLNHYDRFIAISKITYVIKCTKMAPIEFLYETQ